MPDSQSPQVSIIVPAFNPGAYLALAIQSALDQTFTDFEAIIIDDGSTEDISRNLPTDPRVRIHRQENTGLARARNAGMRLARGKYIAFLDADDLWLPTKMRAQFDLMETRPAVALCDTEFEIVDEDGTAIGPGYTGCHENYLDLLTGCGICVSTVMVRRDCLDVVGFFNVGVPGCEDYDMWLKISRRFEIARAPGSQAHYRIHRRNMSKNYAMMYRNFRKVLQKHGTDAKQSHNGPATDAVRAGLKRADDIFAAQAIDQARKSFRERKLLRTLKHLERALWINPGLLVKSVAGKVTGR